MNVILVQKMTNNYARLVYQSLLGVSFFTVTCYYISGDDLSPNPEKKSERNTGWTKTKYKERKVKDAKITKTKCVNCLQYSFSHHTGTT